jgi:hypothetical protein
VELVPCCAVLVPNYAELVLFVPIQAFDQKIGLDRRNTCMPYGMFINKPLNSLRLLDRCPMSAKGA